MTSYSDAGVDLDGADRHVSRIGPIVRSTWDGTVQGGFGGFAAGVTIPDGYIDPIVMMTTDGVGTKLDLARRSGTWSGVGHDLVAMCVDDLAAVGAEPIGFVDYMAVGALNAKRDESIVESIARACTEAHCPLLGGETAEHPGVMDHDAVDLAGTATGVVGRSDVLGPHRVSAGDMVIGLMSPNVRSNGFSLIRKLFDENPPYEQLLQPSVIYSPSVLSARKLIHAAAHITGGGLPGNLGRALPDGLGAEIDSASWIIPEIFRLIESRGVEREEMFSTFNMGIGFCLVVGGDEVAEVITTTAEHEPKVIGTVTGTSGIRIR